MPLKAFLPLSQIRKCSSRLKILEVKIGKVFLHNALRGTLSYEDALLCNLMDGNITWHGTFKHLLKYVSLCNPHFITMMFNVLSSS